MPDPVMYIFINRGAGMSPGKIAAQAAHAAVEAYRKTPQDSNLLRLWYKGGHYKKVVLLARDTTHLLAIANYLTDRGFDNCLIIDEGHTEVDPHTMTALGVPIVDKSEPHTAATFSSFELYKEPAAPAKRRSWLRGRGLVEV